MRLHLGDGSHSLDNVQNLQKTVFRNDRLQRGPISILALSYAPKKEGGTVQPILGWFDIVYLLIQKIQPLNFTTV